jgi:hypothetical protein
MLDGIAMQNNPRVAAVTNMVNMDDLLNNEIGGIVRVKDINALREFAIGTGSTAILPALQFFDETVRAKTGVTGAAMGMDADVLQSQTAAGVNAAVQAAAAVSELIARNLAEGGMKQMFKLIAQIARQHPNPDEMIRIDGNFVVVDPPFLDKRLGRHHECWPWQQPARRAHCCAANDAANADADLASIWSIQWSCHDDWHAQHAGRHSRHGGCSQR